MSSGLEAGFLLDQQWYWLLPRDALIAAGFCMTGENWISPDGVPVQFSDDRALSAAIAAAGDITTDGVSLRVIGMADLLHEKLRAANDPARRRSKRFQDLGDVHALLERSPELERELTAEERAIVKRGAPA